MRRSRDRLCEERRAHFAVSRDQDAKKAGARLREIGAELADQEAALEGINDKLIAMSQAHTAACSADMEARRDLERGACDVALEVLDAALRMLEIAWARAGAEAKTLEGRGDSWGTGHLRRVLHGLEPARLAQNGPFELVLPHYPETG